LKVRNKNVFFYTRLITNALLQHFWLVPPIILYLEDLGQNVDVDSKEEEARHPNV
jgi:hypothetical protein